MIEPGDERPACFGKMDEVFPLGEDGLRHSPERCMLTCIYKTECLRTAIQGSEGTTVQEEKVDRAYESGNMGFWERWAKRKSLHLKKKKQADAKKGAS